MTIPLPSFPSTPSLPSAPSLPVVGILLPASSRIHEPFNIYYELCLNFLPMVRDWDLHFSITNSEIFELERHYQPSFIAECRHYPLPELGIIFGLGYKPSACCQGTRLLHRHHSAKRTRQIEQTTRNNLRIPRAWYRPPNQEGAPRDRRPNGELLLRRR